MKIRATTVFLVVVSITIAGIFIYNEFFSPTPLDLNSRLFVFVSAGGVIIGFLNNAFDLVQKIRELLTEKPKEDEANAPQENILSAQESHAGEYLATKAQAISTVSRGIESISTNIIDSLSSLEQTQKSIEVEKRKLADSLARYIEKLSTNLDEANRRPSESNPYKPLVEYDIQDSSRFYGRTSAIESILNQLERTSLLVLHGESGVGKSSLLKAGIRPELLSQGHLPVYLRPYNIPVNQAIKQAIISDISNYPGLRATSLRDFLIQVTEIQGGKSVVVIIDQFENLFLYQSELQRAEFISELTQCINDDLLPVKWIFSIKADHLSSISSFRPSIQNPLANEYLLDFLTRQEAKEAIQFPALQENIHFEEGVIDQILDDLGGTHIYPPHLQLVCSYLYTKMGSSRQITTKLYDQVGQVKVILQSHLDHVLNSQFAGNEIFLAKNILSTLVTSENKLAFKSLTEITNDLSSQGVETANIQHVLDALATNRLVRVEKSLSENGELQEFYLLAHEYLVEKVEQDPELLERKYTQEILNQRVQQFPISNLYLSSDELRLVKKNSNRLSISKEAAYLIKRSGQKILWQSLATVVSTIVSGVAVYLILSYVFSVFQPQFAFIPILFAASIISFAVIGYNRHFTFELFVLFSAILYFFIIYTLENYVGGFSTFLESITPINAFWLLTILEIVLIFLGYQFSMQEVMSSVIKPRGVLSDKTNLSPRIGKRLEKSLGVVIGAINGYLIIGMALSNLFFANFPLEIFSKYDMNALSKLEAYLPVSWMSHEPVLYFLVAGGMGLILIFFI